MNLTIQNHPHKEPYSPSITAAIKHLSTEAGAESRGETFTRREVVDFILDLAGYSPKKPIYKYRLLEPSFGRGDFLIPAIRRLIKAWRGAKGAHALEDLQGALRAVELHPDTFDATRQMVIDYLRKQDLSSRVSVGLADHWLRQDDFLLTPLDGIFDYVVGNPPYVRQERIPDALLKEYRRRYQTMYDRADLYIPFIERSLSVLRDGGCLGFICADRWMKNRYGGPLRRLIADDYRLKIYVDMVGTDAFHSDVIAYPAITVISKEKAGPTRIAHRPDIDGPTLTRLSQALRSASLRKEVKVVREVACVTNGSEPWLLDSPDQMAIIRRIEEHFPTLENAGCKVGIGVATGADKAFIGNFDSLDVEPDRKLPLVMTRDILSGEVIWRGRGVINPFDEKGGLVDLRRYPRLRRYLNARYKVIAGRHCARKAPPNWYRTIDRINPALTKKPKLLIPDIKGQAHIVFEEGRLYPHHNLYYITSDTWDLRALQAIMLSAVTLLFIATYSTAMHGGFLRFQAQYLRRIRIPHWSDVPEGMRVALIDASTRQDLSACNGLAFKVYGLTSQERSALGGNGE